MRASDLTTKQQTFGAFLRSGSGRVITLCVFLTLVARSVAGTPGVLDWLVVGISLPLVGFVEWTIHLFLLHAPRDSIRMRRLGTGRGHHEHHADPDHLGWLLLGPIEAGIFAVMIAASTAIWVAVLGGLLEVAGWTALGERGFGSAIVSGTLFAYLALAHYEWTHLLVHSRYRPKTRYYRRLARNHRLHHYRNERYWLGITSNLGDRVLGSYPADKSAVPLSDTARTLG